jgi:hypothetical protein
LSYHQNAEDVRARKRWWYERRQLEKLALEIPERHSNESVSQNNH